MIPLRFGLLVALAGSAFAAQSGLVIQVLRGSGTNNNAITGAAISPVIRVAAANGTPVPGVLVVFTAPASGPSVEFIGDGRVGQAITDDSGTAVAPAIKPVGGDGLVEIRVMATKNGLSANAVITQMNLGVDGKAAVAADALEITVIADSDLPPVAEADKSPRRRQIGFRIENGAGKPVAGAQVQFTLELRKRSGKLEPIGQIDRVSGADGWVLATIDRNPGNDTVELTVRASLNGRIATRYFTVK